VSNVALILWCLGVDAWLSVLLALSRGTTNANLARLCTVKLAPWYQTQTLNNVTNVSREAIAISSTTHAICYALTNTIKTIQPWPARVALWTVSPVSTPLSVETVPQTFTFLETNASATVLQVHIKWSIDAFHVILHVWHVLIDKVVPLVLLIITSCLLFSTLESHDAWPYVPMVSFQDPFYRSILSISQSQSACIKNVQSAINLVWFVNPLPFAPVVSRTIPYLVVFV